MSHQLTFGLENDDLVQGQATDQSPLLPASTDAAQLQTRPSPQINFLVECNSAKGSLVVPLFWTAALFDGFTQRRNAACATTTEPMDLFYCTALSITMEV